MDNQNKVTQPLYIMGITIALLYIISFIKLDYSIGFLQLRNVDIFSDIKTNQDADQPMNYLPGNFRVNKPLEASFNFLNLFDKDENAHTRVGEKSDNDAIYITAEGKQVPITGNTKQLSYFFDALKNAKTKQVRIAHFGDSAIEGDLVTSDLREALQGKFGGGGVGWLGIVSQDITFRMTTKHTFSGNWETGALYTSNPHNLPLGISGECNVPTGDAWVQYETTNAKKYLRDFTVARLFYANAKSSQIYYSFNGGAKQTATLKPGAGIQELILKPSGSARSIRIEFPTANQAYFYGVSLENGPGVYVDNLPLRGNTGVDLGSLDENVLKGFAKYLDYKLIILEFGLNIAGTRSSDYTWYEREMIKVVNHFKEAFPKTSILMISVQDKSMKRGSNFVTDPTILKLLQAQKNIAKQADVAIWSMFDAMGGENSMPKWVDANPPMAFKDYIHFNDQGAKRIAELLTDALLSLYK